MSQVLVLNATYEPLNVISVRRAVVLLLKEKAEIVEAAGAWLHSQQMALPVPLVIRLVCYVRIPRHFSLPLSRRTVLARDHYTCQYCGERLPKAVLTMDHVQPRSKGGETSGERGGGLRLVQPPQGGPHPRRGPHAALARAAAAALPGPDVPGRGQRAPGVDQVHVFLTPGGAATARPFFAAPNQQWYTIV